ncbi:conjugative transfer ATPase [Morganella morganii]|uniref:conjugative transfer ATPase n=1 Tax=Morganella morganii TaxID=582 RepID=UPI001BDAAC3B|nr:conjugative transfer ATPase [Morganella morganii]EKU4001224.1 conjugative transfer ATPase [Morganella morganii]MBT0404785.1 conjugative transfer ATPase [Morganella morganii subsp. morganii]MBT0423798.1 conjugative transfer ATPase [Morganella morganii subsp. morganii]MBT0471136.1 conjugative transfer ATPase [Morganella morganii subsp. morganii]QWM01120.1 conjugative transfer ATPase [Morganella morganii subsp. morganii]
MPGLLTKKSGTLTQSDTDKLYPVNPSFTDYLPWAEYLPESQCLLLDDGVSVGAVFEVIPAGTEGRTATRLDEIRDIAEDALQDSFDERDSHPWVIQFFCQDDPEVTAYLDTLRGYIRPQAQDTVMTADYLRETERHMRGLAVPQGLFTDKAVTGAPWRGQQRRTRMVIYRYADPAVSEPLSPEEQLNQVCDRLASALAGAGIAVLRQNGVQIHAWLLRWFNPAPDWTDKETLYRTAAHEDTAPGELPLVNDFSEMLLFSPPRADAENGVWWFDGLPHCAVTIDRIRRAPAVGHLTGETRRGEHVNALMDLLPPGTVISLTLVVQPQDVLEARFTHLAKNAIGENSESARVRADAETAKSYLGERHKLWRGSMTFYLSASSLQQLNRQRREMTAVLLNAGLQPVRPEYDVAPLNGWLRALPMCFDPARDKKHWYTRLMFVQHLANMLPVFGRDSGTGHPGFTFFNRGGAPLTFDPLNSADRSKNAHLVLFGPTGSGKSATLNSLFAQLMAVHRPRLFIAEAGNSFGLFADYCAALELTVHKISIKPGCGISLAPFADAHKLAGMPQKSGELSDDIGADDAETEERDILGELFNREGRHWPEADITLIDLGTLAREGYEAPLAVAYTSLVNTINNIAERDQFLEREIVFATDEAHMITTNPLLAPYVVKVVKMWRKLGAWLWLATQNLEDFPDTAKKMLNMIEWWLCLVMPPEEVEEIARFRKLTDEQKAMLLSATKTPRCYTEGVVLASRIEALFRAVPPSLYLALGMTEKEEKAARRELMIKHGISELEAAKRVARELDKGRGIEVSTG